MQAQQLQRYAAVIDSYLVLAELLIAEQHRHIDL
jgi:hypothetical protein